MTGASSGQISGGTATFIAGGSVSSVFGRTGAVTAQTGDYSIAQISGAGTAAAENLSSVIIDDGGGALTIGNLQVTAAMIASIAGFISAGSNVTITGSGTIASPYVIASTGGGGGGGVPQSIFNTFG